MAGIEDLIKNKKVKELAWELINKYPEGEMSFKHAMDTARSMIFGAEGPEIRNDRQFSEDLLPPIRGEIGGRGPILSPPQMPESEVDLPKFNQG